MLEKYQKKRNFQKTPEPKGSKTENEDKNLRFVVQKHQASRLHYDFRLEVDGVLKSWAIPKGPSLDPEEKRLAVMVEDHPFEYRNFEGVIPKGNYGAGTVMIWDEGNYRLLDQEKSKSKEEEKIRESIKNGHLTFILNGQKLRGEFALIRLKKAGENNWLLLKAKKDEYFSARDVLELEKSVRSGLTLEQISEQASKTGQFWTSRTKKVEIDAPKSNFPHNIKPMMSTLAKDVFDDKNWLFEIKWDGYRAITEIKDRKIRIYSRNNIDFNLRFPQIVNSFQSFRKNAVFDGEIVTVDENGKPSFQLLQDYLLHQKGQLVYYVFDLLYFDGYDLTNLPLIKRKKILKKVLPKVPNIQYSEEIFDKGKDFFEVAKKEDLEGIMAKKIDSTYQVGKRSHDWLKIKNHLEQEVVIGGFTAPKGARESFGSIAVGVYKNGKLQYIGNVGTGFNELLLKSLREKFEPLIQKESPFQNISELRGVTWLKPVLVAEVKFQEWTSEKNMRQPVFLGLREDKDSKKVKREI